MRTVHPKNNACTAQLIHIDQGFFTDIGKPYDANEAPIENMGIYLVDSSF